MKENRDYSEAHERISMLVYTQSFVCDKDAFLYFKNANLLQHISICYMPLLDKHKISLPIETGHYKHTSEENAIRISIEFSDCASGVFISSNVPREESEDELNDIAEKCILHNRLHELFDYISYNKEKDYENIFYNNAKNFLGSLLD